MMDETFELVFLTEIVFWYIKKKQSFVKPILSSVHSESKNTILKVIF